VSAGLLYALTGAAIFCIGIHGLIVYRHLLRKILAANIMGSGVFLALVGLAQRGAAVPDPVPQALVLTGIVVAVSATALALALARRVAVETGTAELPEHDSDDA
jgi:multicomponent Na+:H+ antiporter subunit C